MDPSPNVSLLLRVIGEEYCVNSNKQPIIIFDVREFSILFQTSPASYFLKISCQLFFPRVTFPMDALKINALNCSFFELKSTKTDKLSQKRKDRVTSGVSKSKIPP